ncbi:MAG: hypothetical protein WC319_08490, partial [Candidatus Paceibacterota bacterium]
MKTLKEQIENQVSVFPEYFTRQLNQECTIIDRMMAPNGCGSEFVLVDFVTSGHPSDSKGLQVVVIED